MLCRVVRGLTRGFCAAKEVQKTGGSSVVEGEKGQKVPVHLRPYDKSKYEVPMEKIKLNSGYAFLQIEPFPRAKIMKTCYHILEQLSIGFPETCVYRIYNEERTKYFMKIVDETTDIEQLEDMLAVETIELFIDNLVGQLEIIAAMRKLKIWEYENSTEEDIEGLEGIFPPQAEKNPAYKKPERPKAPFMDLLEEDQRVVYSGVIKAKEGFIQKVKDLSSLSL